MKNIEKILDAIENGADFITFWTEQEKIIPATIGKTGMEEIKNAENKANG